MKKGYIVVILIILLMPLSVFARSGCCSHHGGVSGCSSSGKQLCSDGTTSPTCTCTPTKTVTSTNTSTSKIISASTNTSTDNTNNANNNDTDAVVSQTISGCTDATAKNYNSSANSDDGSCQYASKEDEVTNEITDGKKNSSELISKDTSDEDSNTSFYVYLIICVIIFIISNYKKKTGFLIADRISSIKPFLIKLILYFCYIIFIIPFFIDILSFIVYKLVSLNKIKK